MRKINFTGNVIAVLIAISVLFIFIGASTADLDNGLLAYYPFNGNANDMSGNGHHATVVGPTLTVDRENNSASAYSFDGVNDYIDIPYSPSIEPSVFSLSIWFKTSTSNQGALWSTDPNMLYCKHGYMIVISGNNSNPTLPVVPNGTPLFTIDPSTACSGYGPTIRGDYPLNGGNWHHMVAIYNGSSMKMYVDGVLQDETKNTIYRKTGASIRVGMNRRTRNHPEWRWFYQGSIDDIRLYNRVLSDAEIKQLANSSSMPIAEIIGTWSSGIWYRNVAASSWKQMNTDVPSGDIAAGDFTGDGKADVASIWSSGLYYQNGANLSWTKVTSTAPYTVTAGDVTGDGLAEIIGTWSSGIWYRNVAASSWKQMNTDVPSGAIAAGDFTGDGKADVASIWSSGLYYQNGANLSWTKVTSTAPYTVTAGDVTGDGLAEIIGTWSSGIWYRNVAASSWKQMNTGVPSGAIAAGDFTGDGKADVASIWSSGLWFQNGATLGWKKVTSDAPYELTAGDVTGN